MRYGSETRRFDDGHPGSGFRFPSQNDWTGHMMAASSDGEPDCGKSRIQTIPYELSGGKDLIPPQVRELYAGIPVTFYYQKVNPQDTINENHRRAAADIVVQIRTAVARGKVFLGALFGPMAAGKGVVGWAIANDLPSVRGFKQITDERRGSDYITNSNGDSSLKVKAGLFTRLEQLLPQVRTGDIALIDEVQFSPNNPEEIQAFLNQLRSQGVHAILSALDFDFKREPWRSTLPILQGVDHAFVLAAACVTPGCGAPASFTQRTLPDGSPAHTDDPLIQLGSVADSYSSRCGKCHTVLPGRNVLASDSGNQ